MVSLSSLKVTSGKPAGVRCVQLDDQERCRIFQHPERPAVCSSLQPDEQMCGSNREHAMHWLGWLQRQTDPD
ncbi:proteinase inhibitor [Massilia sp. UMI-21]|nr:proteinase inhibitor [Massilia sp. UMI-21]